MPEVNANADLGVKIVVLLNKCDVENKELDFEEVKSYCQGKGIDVYETSAKTGKNVNQVFVDICKQLLISKSTLPSQFDQSSNLSASANYKTDDDSSCCN